MADAADLQVTLLVAGCSRPAEGTAEAAPPPSAPGLATVISRGDRVASSAGGVEAHLLALFGVNAMREEGVPVAPITRAYDAGEPAAGWWLRADPVEAQADQHTVRLLGNRHLRLAPHEARALAAELNGLLAEDGLVLQPLDPLRWYLGLAVDPGFCGLSVDASVGRDLYACLPSGTQAQRWRRLLTELQMLLSVSPVNQARVARGEPPVTSLWLWGGGALPRVPGGGWTGVASDEPLSCGLAQLAGVVRGARPADAAAWLATSPPSGSHLIVLGETAEQTDSAGAWAHWCERVLGLERDWIQPLLALMREGRLASLALDTAPGPRWSLTRRSLRRWWRRPRLEALG